MVAAQAGPPNEWGVSNVVYPVTDRLALLALILVPPLLVVAVLGVLIGSLWVAAVLAAGWLVRCFVDARLRDPIQLRRIGARPLRAGEGARLRNLAGGLASQLSMSPPQLYLIDAGGPNAFVSAGGRGGVIAVTRSLLAGFTRTELEAVVAHCLVRINAPGFVYSNLAARWSDLGAGLAPRVDASTDLRAVALTRYPPALATALEKADPRVARYAPLWFVADAPSHQAVAERIALVSDL